jgi:hypothetical protein
MINKTFPKQTSPIGPANSLEAHIRGYGCHLCCLIYAVTKFFNIDTTIATQNIIDITKAGIDKGLVLDNFAPIDWSPEKIDTWYRCFIPDSVKFMKFVGEYFGQKLEVSYKAFGDTKHPLKIEKYGEVPANVNFVEIERKDSICQHFTIGINPVKGGDIIEEYNPDPTLIMSYVISLRYISLKRV